MKCIQRAFGENSADAQAYKGQGEVSLVEGFNSTFGRSSQLGHTLEQYGEAKKSANGVEMFNFLDSNEMNTLEDCARKPGTQ